MPLGPNPNYLVRYNGYVLPGYAQRESFDSIMNIADHYGAYVDGSLSEPTGLNNKQIGLTMKVWEQDYLSCKEQLSLAGTYLRSAKGFAPLYVQYEDRYYTALVKDIHFEQDATRSKRVLEYDVTFEARPWLEEATTTTIQVTGAGTMTTTGRTLADGGWTPAYLTAAQSNNLTVSGYTDTSVFTGFISASGNITGLAVNSETHTAIRNSTINALDLIKNKDFELYVGPGETNFTVTNSSGITQVTWRNRWYI